MTYQYHLWINETKIRLSLQSHLNAESLQTNLEEWNSTRLHFIFCAQGSHLFYPRKWERLCFATLHFPVVSCILFLLVVELFWHATPPSQQHLLLTWYSDVWIVIKAHLCGPPPPPPHTHTASFSLLNVYNVSGQVLNMKVIKSFN